MTNTPTPVGVPAGPATAAATETPRAKTQSPSATSLEQDATRAYLTRIGKIPLLTVEEEVEFARDIEAGVYAQHLLDTDQPHAHATRSDLQELARIGETSMQRMVEANLRLVVPVARKFTWSDLTMLDLIQEGNLGVIRTVQRFDYTKGLKFSTYATWWIRQRIIRAIQDTSRAVRIPNQHHLTHNRVRRATIELAEKLGRVPTDVEIAEHTELHPDHITDLALLFQHTSSLDMPIDPDGPATLADLLTDPNSMLDYEAVENRLDGRAVQLALSAAIAELPDKERQLLTLRMGRSGGQPMTIGDASVVLGLNRETARKLESKAIKKLRFNNALAELRGYPPIRSAVNGRYPAQ